MRHAYRRLLHHPLRHASRLARASRSFGSQPFAYVVINPWDPTLGHGGALGILQEMNPLTASEIGIVALVARGRGSATRDARDAAPREPARALGEEFGRELLDVRREAGVVARFVHQNELFARVLGRVVARDAQTCVATDAIDAMPAIVDR